MKRLDWIPGAVFLGALCAMPMAMAEYFKRKDDKNANPHR